MEFGGETSIKSSIWKAEDVEEYLKYLSVEGLWEWQMHGTDFFRQGIPVVLFLIYY